MTVPGLMHAIDFGTSNSTIIVSQPDSSLLPIPDPIGLAGSESIRTSVCVMRDGRIEVGTAAERAKALDPAAYRSEFKRDFGDPTPTTLAGRVMTADDLTAEILRFLREQAQQVVPGDPALVVITIPASWEGGNQDLMRSAAQRAGYENASVVLVPEPVAALAYAFGERRGPAGRLTVLVYDLGGGTFDCAVARGTAEGYEVLGAPGGLDDVAGSAFDRLLLALVRERFPDETAAMADVRTDETDALRRSLLLKDTCETIKWRLSATGRVEVLLSELRPPRELVLERAEFEELIRPLLAETIGECERLLERLDLDWPDVDRIAPVGGSSKIPLVGEMLAAKCGRPVLAVDRPDTAVAYGAALFGRDLQRDQAPRTVLVNGRRTVCRKRHLGYDEVVGEAPGQVPGGPGMTVTVTYQRAAGARAAGSLVPGGVVEIQDGTIFNVTTTDKS